MQFCTEKDINQGSQKVGHTGQVTQRNGDYNLRSFIEISKYCCCDQSRFSTYTERPSANKLIEVFSQFKVRGLSEEHYTLQTFDIV